MNAVIYCRISSDPTGKRAGVERQEQECRELAERQGWNVGRVYVDNDISAFTGKARPAYAAMLGAAKNGDADVIVAWHPDRLHRSPAELEPFIDVIEATGAQVATVTAGAYDLSTAAGRMNARIVGAVARHESEHKSERIRSQRVHAADAGQFFGGRVPFGYRLDGGKLALDPEHAAAIRDAYTTILGGGTLASVVRDWSARRLGGRQWNFQRVREALTRPRIAGIVVHRGTPMPDVEADWPAIVSRDDLTMMVALFDRRRSGPRPPRVPALLSGGIARCARCDTGMTMNRQIKYRCPKCMMTVSRERLEGAVIAALTKQLTGPAWLTEYEGYRAIATKDVDLTPLREAESRLTMVAEMFGAGELDADQYRAAHKAATERVEHLRGELGTAVETKIIATTALPDATGWSDPPADDDEARRWVRAFIDRVEVRPATGRKWSDDRYRIVWRPVDTIATGPQAEAIGRLHRRPQLKLT